MRFLFFCVITFVLLTTRPVLSQQGGTVPTFESLCEGSDLIVIAQVMATAPIIRSDRLVNRVPGDLEIGIEYELKVEKLFKASLKKASPGTIKLIFELGSAHSSYPIAKGRHYLFFLSKTILNEEKYSPVIVGRTSKGIDVPENAFNISEYYKAVKGNWGIAGNKQRIGELVDQLDSRRDCTAASSHSPQTTQIDIPIGSLASSRRKWLAPDSTPDSL